MRRKNDAYMWRTKENPDVTSNSREVEGFRGTIERKNEIIH